MPIQKRSKDDFMSRQMDARLSEMEASISNVYQQAVEETTTRLNSYMEAYEEENRVMRARLLEGEITEEEYEVWARKNLLRTHDYSTTIDSLTEMLVNADTAAIALVNGELPYVVSESYNFTQFVGHIIADHEDIPNVSFQIYNAQSVQAIIQDNPQILPVVDPELDTEWNRTRLNREITQGIIQGSTIPDLATRLQRVTQMDKNSAIRAARTSMTSAENMGRNESHRRITSQGIDMVKRWSAAYDARTRDSHRLLDNTTANDKGLFGEGILDKLGEPLMEFPGDPKGAAAEIYNCRCRLNIVPPNYSREANAQAYERWMQENYPADYRALNESNYFDRLHKTDEWTAEAQQRVDRRIERLNNMPSVYELTPADNTNSGNIGVVKGKDITGTWQRRADEFEFEINDVMNAQGFDGLPRVVSAEEFDKAVQESGFIAQRTYSATDQETLDSYRDMLYKGEWYVDCSIGGAQYGQGMYCAADYNGELTDGIRAEMSHYQELAAERFGGERPEAEQMADVMRLINQRFDDVPEGTEQYMRALRFGHSDADYELMDAFEDRIGGYDEAYKFRKIWNEVPEFGEVYTYTETLTLVPDANILTVNRQTDGLDILSHEYVARRVTEEQKPLIDRYRELMEEYNSTRSITRQDELHSEITEMRRSPEFRDIWHMYDDFSRMYGGKDLGVVASAMGYDAINAEGHGESGSYTVILNRTAVIFREGG